MKLNDSIISILEYHGFSVDEVKKQGNEYNVDISQYTPEGEDWFEIIWFNGTNNGFIEAVQNASHNFDPEDAAMVWIPCRGKNGVPESIKALLEDAEWKVRKLEALANDLSDVYEC